MKLYLDASPEQRARRRYMELRQRGEPAELEDILAAVLARDRIDSTRQMSPLRPAEDAIILDSDRIDADQVFKKVERMLSEK
jgi:cytidylate kinase